jgi:hypothetical protein
VQAAGSRTPSAEVVVPVDPLHRDVLNVVEARKGPARNGLRQLMASVLNSPIVVSVGALFHVINCARSGR